MKGELTINGKDAYETYGVTLMGDSVSQLLTPAGLKSFVENSSRLEDGKHIITTNTKKNSLAKVDSREVTLTFGIKGKDKADYYGKLQALCDVLQKGYVEITLPTVGTDVYKLVYSKCTTYAQNIQQTFCKMAAKFSEPNPTDREVKSEK